MNVYLVIDSWGNDILGIFDTKEEALLAKANEIKRYINPSEYNIYEIGLNEKRRLWNTV